MTTKQFYNLMQDWLGSRTLVDKTPYYSLDMKTLERAEVDFENPVCIHLVRHPYGMIASYEQAKLALLLGRQYYTDKLPFSERELAELIWIVCQQNILRLLEHVPEDRQCCIKFEDLVNNPQTTVEYLCQSLNLDFQPEMLQPYKEKKQRMTDGIHTASRMIGDVKFNEHKGINAEVTDRWKSYYKTDFLGDITWQIADSFGYQRIQGEWNIIGKIDRVREKSTKQLPTILDQLSDEKVDHLLSTKLGQLSDEVVEPLLEDMKEKDKK